MRLMTRMQLVCVRSTSNVGSAGACTTAHENCIASRLRFSLPWVNVIPVAQAHAARPQGGCLRYSQWPRDFPSSPATPNASAGDATGIARRTRSSAAMAPLPRRIHRNCSATTGWNGGSMRSSHRNQLIPWRRQAQGTSLRVNSSMVQPGRPSRRGRERMEQ